MEEFVLNSFETYGPFAVFLLLMLSGFGIPLGEDIILIPAGFFIAEGGLPLELTAVLAYFGVVLADFTWFGLISRYGTRLLHQRWVRKMIHPRRLLQAKHQIDKRGTWMIVFARFIPGSRASAITGAAMLHLPFWKFAIATASCVLITVPLQLGLGLLIARGVRSEDTALMIMKIIGLLVLLILVFLVSSKIRHYRSSKRGVPRAKAKWLRRFRLPHRRRHSQGKATRPGSPTTPGQSQ